MLLSRSDAISTGNWFVIRVRPNCEWKCAASLAARGFDVMVPSYQRQSNRHPKKAVRLPLFPGYMFCRSDGKSLVPILAAAEVIQILSRNGVPEIVNPAEIASVLTVMSRGIPLEPVLVFKEGQPVKVSVGPLAGTEGFVVRDTAKTLLIISISLLQRSVAARIERVWVEAA